MGDSGKYQKSLVLMSILSNFSSAFSGTTLLSFTVADPIPECLNSRGIWEHCTESEACENLSFGKGKLSYKFDSWVEKYQMVCGLKDRRSSGKSLVYLFRSLTIPVVLSSSDFIGRKQSLILCVLLVLSLMTTTFFLQSFIFKLVLCGIVSGVVVSFPALFNMMINECTCKSQSKK